MVYKVTQPPKRVMQTSLEASKARRAYWAGIQQAKAEGKPVIGVVGLLPREIWYAMDMPFLMLEHLAILVSAKQLSGHYCDVSEERGFSRDLCAAHSTLLGIAGSDERDPYVESLFVVPDAIIASNFPCMSESKSFLYWIERFKCPYFFVDAPINTWGRDIDDYAVEYYVAQLKGMISFVEGYGYKLDWDKLKKAVANTRRLTELWLEVEEYRKAVPAPMGMADSLTCIGYPLFILPGTERGVEIFEKLRDEVKYRVENKMGVIENERLRLLWLGVPPVYNMGLLSYPEKYGAVIVKSEVDFLGGGMADPKVLDPEKPLESVCKKTLTDFANPCFANRIDLVVNMVKDYKVDGVIAVNKRGCRNLPAGLRLAKDAVYEETGVPTTIFDLDGLDPRDYNDAQAKANIDAFIETLLEKKGEVQK